MKEKEKKAALDKMPGGYEGLNEEMKKDYQRIVDEIAKLEIKRNDNKIMKDDNGKAMTRMDYHMKNVDKKPSVNFPKKEKMEAEVVSDTEDEHPDDKTKFMISNNSFMLGVPNSANRN
jgi:hypothetical protein